MLLLKGSDMKRRQFIGWVGGAAIAWPFAVLAQSGRTRRIAVFISGSERDPEMQSPLAAFKAALQQLKWIDGTNVRIDYRFADGKAERYTEIAKEIVALRPDVILVRGTPNTAALLKETRRSQSYLSEFRPGRRPSDRKPGAAERQRHRPSALWPGVPANGSLCSRKSRHLFHVPCSCRTRAPVRSVFCSLRQGGSTSARS